jgi:hypothetical protein
MSTNGSLIPKSSKYKAYYMSKGTNTKTGSPMASAKTLSNFSGNVNKRKKLGGISANHYNINSSGITV